MGSKKVACVRSPHVSKGSRFEERAQTGVCMHRTIQMTAIVGCFAFVFAATGVFAQDKPCPKVTVVTPNPKDKIYGRGETYIINAFVAPPPSPETEVTFN